MLIQVDNRPIRRSYTALLRRARRGITRLETQIARYHEVDSPAFYLWYHREFGQILSNHRRLREQITAHEFIQRDPDIETAGQASCNQKTQARASSPENDSSASDYLLRCIKKAMRRRYDAEVSMPSRFCCNALQHLLTGLAGRGPDLILRAP